jgi:hypothetical protein
MVTIARTHVSSRETSPRSRAPCRRGPIERVCSSAEDGRAGDGQVTAQGRPAAPELGDRIVRASVTPPPLVATAAKAQPVPGEWATPRGGGIVRLG